MNTEKHRLRTTRKRLLPHITTQKRGVNVVSQPIEITRLISCFQLKNTITTQKSRKTPIYIFYSQPILTIKCGKCGRSHKSFNISMLLPHLGAVFVW